MKARLQHPHQQCRRQTRSLIGDAFAPLTGVNRTEQGEEKAQKQRQAPAKSSTRNIYGKIYGKTAQIGTFGEGKALTGCLRAVDGLLIRSLGRVAR